MCQAARWVAVLGFAWTAWGQLPNNREGFRFAVIGDTGTGSKSQYEVGARLSEIRKETPFETVVMLGDNIYGGHSPKDFEKKFALPYKSLLESGVQFFAALGNHDGISQQSYKPFNMGGKRYYSFQPRPGIRFYALDSSRMDKPQVDWFEAELAKAGNDWKIVYFHHPLYSSGARHGSNMPLRKQVEPLLIKYGVALALAGHDHFYERIHPQSGVCYFVVGGSAKVRVGNCKRTTMTAEAFDKDNSFALMEVDRDMLYFQAFSRTGQTIDKGSYPRPKAQTQVTTDSNQPIQ